MPDQIIVAVYDTPAHAELAVQDLLEAGVPDKAVERHAQEGSYTGASLTLTSRPADRRGFWASLFGGEPDHDTAVYDYSVQSGSTVVSVTAPGEHVRRVLAILDSHAPVDLDKRARDFAVSARKAGRAAPTDDAGHPLVSGSRVVNAGTGRIRQFIAEPTASVNEMYAGENGSFAESVFETNETMEQLLIAKRIYVREEIVLRKIASDRVQTVGGTVRHEDVEIVKLPDDPITAPTPPKQP